MAHEKRLCRQRGETAWLGVVLFLLRWIDRGQPVRAAALLRKKNIGNAEIFDRMARDSADDHRHIVRRPVTRDATDDHPLERSDSDVLSDRADALQAGGTMARCGCRAWLYRKK
jgi:hypothetical protein